MENYNNDNNITKKNNGNNKKENLLALTELIACITVSGSVDNWCFYRKLSIVNFMSLSKTHGNNGNFQETQEAPSEEQQEESEASVKQRVLNSALEFVPAFGWSVEALSEGARAEGFPGVAHGMFPRGGGDLVHHFVRECNDQLAEKLAREVQEETAEEERDGGRR